MVNPRWLAFKDERPNKLCKVGNSIQLTDLSSSRRKKVSNLSYSLLSILQNRISGEIYLAFQRSSVCCDSSKGQLNTRLQILYWSVQWLWVLAEVILGTLFIHKKQFTATWNKCIEIILARYSHSEKSYLNSFFACIQLDAVEQEHVLNVISSQTFSLSKMTLENPPLLLQVS